ncbi:TetR family transcriptional regulator [Streptomyces sp. NPDC057654]|uniref:TetR family transcriptional regulator n=1 Tax=Streptomyces sp. NPDC057654 TaxID=3346196 RepID=UPI0036B9C0F3
MKTEQETERSAGKPAGRCAGLRERKKRRTRDALVRAALELFVEKGYEQTTVDEIADAVDVSQRTFFRYFAGKEDAAFALQELIETRFLSEVCARPAHEPPMPALRNAITNAWATIDEEMKAVAPPQLHMRMFQVIESTPALLAVHLRRQYDTEERIAQEIARREGLDIDADPRPRVLVAAFAGTMRVAGKIWGEGDDWTSDAIRELSDTYLDALVPALAENWRASSRT